MIDLTDNMDLDIVDIVDVVGVVDFTDMVDHVDIVKLFFCTENPDGNSLFLSQFQQCNFY